MQAIKENKDNLTGRPEIPPPRPQDGPSWASAFVQGDVGLYWQGRQPFSLLHENNTLFLSCS